MNDRIRRQIEEFKEEADLSRTRLTDPVEVFLEKCRIQDELNYALSPEIVSQACPFN